MTNHCLCFLYIPANCYKRVMDETQQMQKKIEEQIGLNPDEKEVVVLYDGERDKVYRTAKSVSNEFLIEFVDIFYFESNQSFLIICCYFDFFF